METTKIKRCPKCKQKLPVDKFNKNRCAKDGLQYRCRGCTIRENKEYYATEHGREVQRRGNEAYHKTKRGQEVMYRATRKYCITLKGHLTRMFNDMKQRRNNSSHRSYKYYGGRGIQNKFRSSGDFRDYIIGGLGIMSIEQIKGLQIDRINNDGHYEEGNVRFVTPKVNMGNRGGG